MEENIHKDKLEKFFKNAFNEDNADLSGEGWDVPSDRVWNNIHEKINPSRTAVYAISYKRILAVAALLLILVLVFYNYYLQRQVSDLKIQVENYRKELLELKKESPGSEKQNKEGNSSGINSPEDNNQPSNRISENSNPEATALSADPEKTVPESRNPLTRSYPNQPSPLKPARENEWPPAGDAVSTDSGTDGNGLQSSVSINEQNNQANDHKTKAITTTPLFTIPTKAIFAETIHPLDSMMPVPILVAGNRPELPVVPASETGFYAGAHFAPSYSYRNIKSVNGPVLRRLLNEKEQPAYTIALGIKAGYQFAKNLSFESGLNYYKNSIQSMHLAQIRYERQFEQLNNDGDYDSNYQLKLSTSYGDIETDVALTRNSSTQIEQNDYINLAFKTNQELTYLGVPLALRYRTGGNKFHLSAKAGITGNFILKKEVTITGTQVRRPGVHHNRTIVERKFSGLKDSSFDFLFGIGADYDISNKAGVYFEPVLSHSLSPVYALNGKIKTYPMVVSLNIGFMYWF